MAKRDKMFAMIERWQRSDKSKAAFARDAGVSINTFHYWCRRFDEECRDLPSLPFVEVTNGAVDEVSLGKPRLPVEYPDGVIISIYLRGHVQPFTTSTVLSLLPTESG